MPAIKSSRNGESLRQRKPVKADSSKSVTPPAAEQEQPTSKIIDFLHSLFDPIDNSVLAVFRIGWGMIMFYECLTYLSGGAAKMDYYFFSTAYHFKYWGFHWVVTGPPWLMRLYFQALSIIALCFTVGLFYRLSAVLFFFGFTYFYLIDMALYLNHFYLVAVISFMFIFLPAHRDWSIDALIWPQWRSPTMPRWVLYLIRALILIVYFYAAVAKMNCDWLRGEPLRHWLAKRYALPLIGPLLVSSWAPYFFSWGGLAVDLVVAPLFLFRRTRWLALAGTIAFHSLNKYIFSIGIFPAVMLLTTAVFYDPAWPRQLLNPRAANQSAPRGVPPRPRRRRGFTPGEVVVLFCLGAFLVYHVAMPLRYLMYPGDVAWTEWGHRWSWRMKLRDKNCDTRLYVHPVSTYADNGTAVYGPPEEVPLYKFINAKQVRKLSGRAELVQQLAHFVADSLNASGMPRPKVTAYAMCQLNFRTPAELIDPTVDLAAEPLWVWPNHWQTHYPPELTPEEQAQLPWNWHWRAALRRVLGMESDDERRERVEREQREDYEQQLLMQWAVKRMRGDE